MMFERAIYGDPAIKGELLAAQHGKCAYCEIRIESEYGAVDHYRPKGGVRQTRAALPTTPGYFWLAYAWDNLLVACSRCNTSKSDLFPLVDPATGQIRLAALTSPARLHCFWIPLKKTPSVTYASTRSGRSLSIRHRAARRSKSSRSTGANCWRPAVSATT